MIGLRQKGTVLVIFSFLFALSGQASIGEGPIFINVAELFQPLTPSSGFNRPVI